MPEPDDLELLALVCSRLCHDLVGPVGAVNNGVELLTELGADGADDVMPLIESSAKQAWHRLDFFRVALGAGGGRTAWGAHELEPLVRGMVAPDKVELAWDVAPGLEFPAATSRIFLNSALIVLEALIRGGRLDVECREEDDVLVWRTEARGPKARPPERVRAYLLHGDAGEGIDARLALAELVRRQAARADVALSWCAADDLFAVEGRSSR